MVSSLRTADTAFGRVWLDIERYKWPPNKTANVLFVTAMIDECTRLGVKVGIYSGYNSWSAIIGADVHVAPRLPLWYAHYDGIKDFGDFNTTEKGGYGGWTLPSMKQFLGDKESCGASIDYNYRPRPI